ncbi:hypothetical protein Y032_0331g2731 [Ancylostoma ceylanicum]|uniref:Uncharacterized protein n=1 Tax=Ancylostoma ceylanicum TaxID=53326 RepID=A0A016S0A7_9BILA|nr:hypothetical protein Y032_0331g2731 [Ancylostoma ceylanicum]
MRSLNVYAEAITNTQFNHIPTSAPTRLRRASQLGFICFVESYWYVSTEVPRSGQVRDSPEASRSTCLT